MPIATMTHHEGTGTNISTTHATDPSASFNGVQWLIILCILGPVPRRSIIRSTVSLFRPTSSSPSPARPTLPILIALPFWLAVLVGVAQMRGAAHFGELPLMPWSAR